MSICAQCPVSCSQVVFLPSLSSSAIQKDKYEPFDVEEVLQEMSKNQIETLWGKLAVLLEHILHELPPERWQGGGEDNMDMETAVDPVSRLMMFYFFSELPQLLCLICCHYIFSSRNTSWLLCTGWRL